MVVVKPCGKCKKLVMIARSTCVQHSYGHGEVELFLHLFLQSTIPWKGKLHQEKNVLVRI